MIPVKVCGICRLQDAQMAVRAGALAIGFIFYPPSSRYLSPEKAAMIAGLLPDTIARIGVFVNEKENEIVKTAKTVGLDFIQLHGEETPDFCEAMPLPVIKAFRVGHSFNPKKMKEFSVHALLLDTYQHGQPGGTGKSFDWEVVRNISMDIPVILSGGLNSENVGKAIEIIHPAAIDINSGAESLPGQKDRQKVSRFFASIQNTVSPAPKIFQTRLV